MIHHRFVRPREMARLRQWAIKETSVDVSFVTTSDGWQLAVSHYRDAAHHPATQRHPVLLCHGLGANRLVFDTDPRYSLAAWLVAQGFDVYAVELRGHGLSEKPGKGKRWGWGMAEYAEIDLPAAFAHVLEYTQKDALHYIGHSMGGILLYSRAALGDGSIKSGIAIGSSLDYSGLPTMFHAVAPLAPLSHFIPFIPVHWGALFSSWATRFSSRLVDASLVRILNWPTAPAASGDISRPAPNPISAHWASSGGSLRRSGFPAKNDTGAMRFGPFREALCAVFRLQPIKYTASGIFISPMNICGKACVFAYTPPFLFYTGRCQHC